MKSRLNICIKSLQKELDQADFMATFKNGLVLLLQGHWHPVAIVIFNYILRLKYYAAHEEG